VLNRHFDLRHYAAHGHAVTEESGWKMPRSNPSVLTDPGKSWNAKWLPLFDELYLLPALTYYFNRNSSARLT